MTTTTQMIKLFPFDTMAMRDEIPSKFLALTNMKTSPIWLLINLGPKDSGGTHWTGLFADHERSIIIYYDSFGLPPPEEVSSIKGFKIRYRNHTQHQALQDTNCGPLTVRAMKIIKKHHKKPLKKFIEAVDTDFMKIKS